MIDKKSILIENIQSNICRENLTKQDIGILLRDVRKLIEFDEKKKVFPKLYFYCNWSLHPEIAQNVELYKILDTINKGFTEIHIVNSETNKKHKHYFEIVIESLSINELEEDLKAFFSIYLPSSNINIGKLLVPIFENLVLNKILYPEKPQSDYFAKKNERIKTEMRKLGNQLNTVDKFLNPKLDPQLDYSNPSLIRSIEVQFVLKNEVFFELEMLSDKALKLRSSFTIE